MTKDEAMTLALEQRITDYLSAGGLFNPELADHVAVRDLLIDCRKALAEQPAQQEPIGKVIASVRHLRSISVELLPEVDVPSVDSMIYTSPQPAQQEPVAWMELLREARDNCKASIVEEGISASRKEYRIDLEARLTAALNTSPPAQRTWVGLSDVEWMNIVNKDQAWFGQRPDEVAHEVAKLVEAKLKEKNT